MNKDALHILLADGDRYCQQLFTQALQAIKIRTVLTKVTDGNLLSDYLDQPDIRIPDIIFMDFALPKKNGLICLSEIRRNKRFQNCSIAIYSATESEKQKEEILVNGANIFFKKPCDFTLLKMTLDHICSINWQYQTSGLRKDNFLLSIDRMNTPGTPPSKVDTTLV